MLFQPIRKNNDARFVPVVLVHDRDEDGEQMMSRMRSIAWQRLKFNALLVCPSFTGAYAFLQNGEGYGPGADQLLLDAITAQTEVGKAVSYTHLRAHETREDLVCRLLLEKKK